MVKLTKTNYYEDLLGYRDAILLLNQRPWCTPLSMHSVHMKQRIRLHPSIALSHPRRCSTLHHTGWASKAVAVDNAVVMMVVVHVMVVVLHRIHCATSRHYRLQNLKSIHYLSPHDCRKWVRPGGHLVTEGML